jgi:hypothetical protein
MTTATQDRTELLTRARQIALTAAHQNGTVTADDVAAKIGEPLGPVAGSIFRTSDFEFTGKRVRSVQPNNHGRELRVWKLTATGAAKVQKQADKVQKHAPVSPVGKQTPASTPLPGWLQ